MILSTLCVGSVLLFNTITQRRTPVPTLVTFPEVVIVATLTPTSELVLVIAPTLTPTVTPTITIQTGAGNSCKYGPPFINPIATPVPNGGHSEFQDYLCVNGYWLIGVGDWVDGKTGDWGTDGIEEQGYVMYNADGSIADRKFINSARNCNPRPDEVNLFFLLDIYYC